MSGDLFHFIMSSPPSSSVEPNLLRLGARIRLTLYSKYFTPENYPDADCLELRFDEILVYNGGGQLEFVPNWYRQVVVPKVRRLLIQVGDTIRMKNRAFQALLIQLKNGEVPRGSLSLSDPGAPLLLYSAQDLRAHLESFLEDYYDTTKRRNEGIDVSLPAACELKVVFRDRAQDLLYEAFDDSDCAPTPQQSSQHSISRPRSHASGSLRSHNMPEVDSRVPREVPEVVTTTSESARGSNGSVGVVPPQDHGGTAGNIVTPDPGATDAPSAASRGYNAEVSPLDGAPETLGNTPDAPTSDFSASKVPSLTPPPNWTPETASTPPDSAFTAPSTLMGFAPFANRLGNRILQGARNLRSVRQSASGAPRSRPRTSPVPTSAPLPRRPPMQTTSPPSTATPPVRLLSHDTTGKTKLSPIFERPRPRSAPPSNAPFVRSRTSSIASHRSAHTDPRWDSHQRDGFKGAGLHSAFWQKNAATRFDTDFGANGSTPAHDAYGGYPADFVGGTSGVPDNGGQCHDNFGGVGGHSGGWNGGPPHYPPDGSIDATQSDDDGPLEGSSWKFFQVVPITALHRFLNPRTGLLRPWRAAHPMYDDQVLCHPVATISRCQDSQSVLSVFLDDYTRFDVQRNQKSFHQNFPKFDSASAGTQVSATLYAYLTRVVDYCVRNHVFVPPPQTILAADKPLGILFDQLPVSVQAQCNSTFSGLLAAAFCAKGTGLVSHPSLAATVTATENGYHTFVQLLIIARHPILDPSGGRSDVPRQSADMSLTDYTKSWTSHVHYQQIEGRFLSDRFFLVQFIDNMAPSLRETLGRDLDTAINRYPVGQPVASRFAPDNLITTLSVMAARHRSLVPFLTKSPRACQADSSVRALTLPPIAEGTLASNGESTQLVAALRGTPASSSTRKTSSSGCYFCTATDHRAAQCPKLQPLLQDRNRCAALARILTGSASSPDSRGGFIRELDVDIDSTPSGEGDNDADDTPPPGDSPEHQPDFR